jgi:hypothetical protein
MALFRLQVLQFLFQVIQVSCYSTNTRTRKNFSAQIKRHDNFQRFSGSRWNPPPHVAQSARSASSATQTKARFVMSKTTTSAPATSPLTLKDAIIDIGLTDGPEGGMDIPGDTEDELFPFGVSCHCQWIEDNTVADAAQRALMIEFATLFTLVPEELELILESIKNYGIKGEAKIKYVLAELILRCLARDKKYAPVIAMLPGYAS